MLSPRQFFRITLLLPLIVPVMVAVAFDGFLTQFLWLSLFVGGIPYLVLAAIIWVALKPENQDRRMPLVILYAPVLFLPLQFGTWIAFLTWNRADATEMGPLILTACIGYVPIALYALFLGYIYVSIAGVAHALFWRLGWVGATRRTTRGRA